ncbi:MAG: hypothetical protein WDN48_11300 [Pseudolabrys sp.]
MPLVEADPVVVLACGLLLVIPVLLVEPVEAPPATDPQGCPFLAPLRLLFSDGLLVLVPALEPVPGLMGVPGVADGFDDGAPLIPAPPDPVPPPALARLCEGKAGAGRDECRRENGERRLFHGHWLLLGFPPVRRQRDGAGVVPGGTLIRGHHAARRIPCV